MSLVACRAEDIVAGGTKDPLAGGAEDPLAGGRGGGVRTGKLLTHCGIFIQLIL